MSLTATIAVLFAVAGCDSGASAHDRVTACLNLYHPATPEQMPANSSFPLVGITYAVPCNALSSEGEGRWEVLVVGPDDKTIRIYFIGGTTGDRSGLLRKVNVNETPTKVTIQIEVGSDPSYPLGASSAVGQTYVTQIVLSHPLAGRTLTGPNNGGVIEHLGATLLAMRRAGVLRPEPPEGRERG
jgi:hypothetical protein